jgi:hypothetical protein
LRPHLRKSVKLGSRLKSKHEGNRAKLIKLVRDYRRRYLVRPNLLQRNSGYESWRT